MSVLCWIAAAGVAMSALALAGSASALTFPIGGLLAYGFAGQVDIPVLVPFAAGNFIYIALADLLPPITTSPIARRKVLHTVCFAVGLSLLWVIAQPISGSWSSDRRAEPRDDLGIRSR